MIESCKTAAAPRPRRVFVLLFAALLVAQAAAAQSPPACTPDAVRDVDFTVNSYLGLKGSNPAVPTTYNLIGSRKFSGAWWSGLGDFYVGDNWFPVETDKQIFCGTVDSFGITNIHDESDWNIVMYPAPGFESFIAKALPYKTSGEFGSGGDEWHVDSQGRYLLEAEITPAEAMFGNRWFSNVRETTPLLHRTVCAYGPFVREEVHGNPPEIHPAEQLWWKEGDDLVVLLASDGSHRFDVALPPITVPASGGGTMRIDPGDSDYLSRNATTLDFHPWIQTKDQRADLGVAFVTDPRAGPQVLGVAGEADFNYLAGASFPNTPQLMVDGRPAVTVSVAQAIAPHVGVSFRDVCRRSDGRVQGYMVVSTATGNGDGKEGFAVMRVYRGVRRATLLVGTLFNDWKPLAPYEEKIVFDDVISSDRDGRGMVDGMIDFDGNGKTDLFATRDGTWWALHDGKGSWQQLNTSSIALSDLRFGDFDGDKKTDIVHIGSDGWFQVSWGGTGPWTRLSNAEGVRDWQVGDFNGDGKTDIVTPVFACLGIGPLGCQQPRIKLRIKYGGVGGWKNLDDQNDWQFYTTLQDYHENFRFGHFNDDRITDILRLYNNAFVVYWNGRGNLHQLAPLPPGVKAHDLFFALSLTTLGHTDVLHADGTGKWIVNESAGPPTLPLPMKYSLDQVRFARFGDGPATQPFALDRVPVAVPPTAQPGVVAVEPSVRLRFVPGSVRNENGVLTMSMNVRYHPGLLPPGTAAALRTPAVTVARQRGNDRALRIRPLVADPANPTVVGAVDGITMERAKATQVELAVGGTQHVASVGGYAIGGEIRTDRIVAGGAGNWASWRGYLAQGLSADAQQRLASAPGAVTRVRTIELELVPHYGSVNREGEIDAGIDDPQTELNEIAYGNDAARRNAVFGGGRVFDIQWQLTLEDTATGQKLPVPAGVARDGRWPRSKLAFTFPQNAKLLKLTAAATVTDSLGNRTAKPIQVELFSQRVTGVSPQRASAWVGAAAPATPALSTRAAYFARDQVLTPAEVRAIVQ